MFPMILEGEAEPSCHTSLCRGYFNSPGKMIMKKESLKLDPKVTSLGMRITSVSGVRGLYGKGKTLSEHDRLNAAIDAYLYTKDQVERAQKLNAKPREFRFVVARDPRPTGEAIRDALLTGMSVALDELNTARGRGAGLPVKVLDIGINTTPVIQNAVRHFDTIGGIMITASHNPVEWNGYKFLTAHVEPGDSYAQRGALLSSKRMSAFKAARAALLDRLAAGEVDVGKTMKTIRNHSAKYSFAYETKGMREESLEAYFKYMREMSGLEDDAALADFVKRAKKTDFTILFDHNGGAARGIMPELLRRFGFKVEEMETALGVPFHVIEPMDEALEPAKRRLEEIGKGFAVVCDWDVDRGTLVLVADGKAQDLSPQYTCALNVFTMLHRYIPEARKPENKKKPMVVVINDNTSGSIRIIADRISREAKLPVKVAEVETGEINLVERMEQCRATGEGLSVIGVEGSCGGVIFGGGDKGSATSRDGTLTALMAGMLMVTTGQPLSTIIKSLPVFYTQFKSIPVKNKAADLEIKRAIKEEFSKRMVAKGGPSTALRAGGHFTLKGLPNKEYSAFKEFHIVGTGVYETVQQDTTGGYKIWLSDPSGNESFAWYRDSKTEPEVYVESDSTDEPESKYLFDMLRGVITKMHVE